MRKKIAVQQLKVGMYLEEFCSSWLNHPFWRSGFVISDARDFERLLASSVSEVWIDSSKGLDLAPDEASTSAVEAGLRVDDQLQQLAFDARPAERTSDGQAYADAAAVCAEAKQMVIAIFQEARMGRAIDTPGARHLVESVFDSVSRNDGALISLVRLKTLSEFTYMHSVAVCVLMVSLASRLGLDREQACSAGLAGLLHDLGKAAMPVEVLHKPGKLSDDEYAIIRRHPEEGSRMLINCGIDGAALDVCQNHHAKIDGSGYPHGLKGEEISLFAKMAAVCDVYDAVSSGRPYKTAWDPAESIRRMAEWTSGHFDPLIFHAFVKSIGIYPVGALVRLDSGRLGVVIGQSAKSLLTPKIKVFFSTKRMARIRPTIVDLSDPACTEKIAAREDPAQWNFPDLVELWSGLSRAPW